MSERASTGRQMKSLRLSVARGEPGETTVAPDGELRVGSAETADLVLRGAAGIDPLHFRVVARGGDYRLRDESASGTWVNGGRVNEVELSDGDRIQAGSVHLVVSLGAPTRAAGGEGGAVGASERMSTADGTPPPPNGPGHPAAYVSLYEEHLEEGADLLGIRRERLSDIEVGWTELNEIDDRIEAHLDALVVGAALAEHVVASRALDGEADGLGMALRLFCRRQAWSRVEDALASMEPQDAARRRSAVEALAIECPDVWRAHLVARLDAGRRPLERALAADVLGRRRWAAASELLPLLSSGDAELVRTALGALSRVDGDTGARPEAFLEDADAEVRALATRLLLGARRREGLDACRRRLMTDAWAPALVASVGDRAACDGIAPALSATLPDVRAAAVEALGLLGRPADVPRLIEVLGDDDLAGHAAWALGILTGAGLATARFVPDAIDPDERFPDEVDSGTSPEHPEGRPFGEWVEGPSTDPALWRAWWAEHGEHFRPELRYRLGEPAGPAASLRSVATPDAPPSLRRAGVDELRYRYALDVEIELDAPVSAQKMHIARLESRVASVVSRTPPGSYALFGVET